MHTSPSPSIKIASWHFSTQSMIHWFKWHKLNLLIISLIELFFSIFFCFHVTSQKLRKWSFLPLKSNNSYKESSDHLDTMETSIELLVPRTMTPEGTETERYPVLNQPVFYTCENLKILYFSFKKSNYLFGQSAKLKANQKLCSKVNSGRCSIDATCRILHSAIVHRECNRSTGLF